MAPNTGTETDDETNTDDETADRTGCDEGSPRRGSSDGRGNHRRGAAGGGQSRRGDCDGGRRRRGRARDGCGRFAETVDGEDVLGVFGAVDGPIVTSTDVADVLGVSTESARRHLNNLVAAGPLRRRKTGRTVVYWRVEAATDD